MFSYPTSTFSGGEESLFQIFECILTTGGVDWEHLLLEKGGLDNVAPFFSMVKRGALPCFKVALQLLIAKKVTGFLGCQLYEAFYVGDAKERLGWRVNLNENPNFKKERDFFIAHKQNSRLQKDFDESQGKGRFHCLSSIFDTIKDVCEEVDYEGKVTFLIPLDYAIVRHVLPIDCLQSQLGEIAILHRLLDYDEKTDKQFLEEILELYPDFLRSAIDDPIVVGGLFLAVSIGNRELFDFLASCYYKFLPKEAQFLKRELRTFIKDLEGNVDREKLLTVYYFSYHKKKNMRQFQDFGSVSKNKQIGTIDFGNFKSLCQNFPEYINIQNNTCPPILFLLIHENDLQNLNRFRSNEYVDWHILAGSLRPFSTVLEQGNNQLTRLFLEILFEKDCALTFLFMQTEKGIELGIKVSHLYDKEVNYIVRHGLGELEEGLDMKTCNQYLKDYNRLEYVELLAGVIHERSPLAAQERLLVYRDLAIRRSNISVMVERGDHSGNTQRGKVPKGPKIQKDTDDKIQVVEKVEEVPTVVTFLDQPILIEEGGCLVKTDRDNVYVYCDEVFWSAQDTENVDVVSRIKTNQFHLRDTGYYGITSTINIVAFESMFYDKSVPIKFNVSDGARVYCAQLKGDIVDNFGHPCTIYLPCEYVPSSDHDKYENGGNIQFDLNLPHRTIENVRKF